MEATDIKAREAELFNYSIKQLRALLKERKVNQSDCLDKRDLVMKVLSSDATTSPNSPSNALPNSPSNSANHSKSKKKKTATGPDLAKCSNCGKTQDISVLAKTFKKCGACQVDHYCSTSCQKAHWPSHKVKCPGKKPGGSVKRRSAKIIQALKDPDGDLNQWILQEFSRHPDSKLVKVSSRPDSDDLSVLGMSARELKKKEFQYLARPLDQIPESQRPPAERFLPVLIQVFTEVPRPGVETRQLLTVAFARKDLTLRKAMKVKQEKEKEPLIRLVVDDDTNPDLSQLSEAEQQRKHEKNIKKWQKSYGTKNVVDLTSRRPV